MDFPENTLLPFFAYGVFCPGEIGFLKLKPFIEKIDHDCHSLGKLLIRDGLTILSLNGNDIVAGSLLHFVPKSAGRAYYSIVELEPDKQYEWGIIAVQTNSVMQSANTLLGINLSNGCTLADRPFVGKKDPLFLEAFELIEEVLRKCSAIQPPIEPNPDFRKFLHLQMAYMLLWSSIERYVTLRYGLGNDVMKKVLQLATDPYFCKALKTHVNRTDKLFSSNDPSSDQAVRLNKDKPNSSLKYYYQVRCNITHRGKAAFDDFGRLRDSLEELFVIFKETLLNAFKESQLS